HLLVATCKRVLRSINETNENRNSRNDPLSPGSKPTEVAFRNLRRLRPGSRNPRATLASTIPIESTTYHSADIGTFRFQQSLHRHLPSLTSCDTLRNRISCPSFPTIDPTFRIR